MRTNFVAFVLCGLIVLAATAADATNLQVLYAFDRTTAEVHQEIKQRFEKENPDVTVEFLAAAQSYEDASQSIMRNAMINDLPDVSFQGLNLVRGLADRGIAVPLDDFIARDGGAGRLGYDVGMLRAGGLNGKTFGIPFAVSTPIIYVNADLVKAAGVDIDAFPTRRARQQDRQSRSERHRILLSMGHHRQLDVREPGVRQWRAHDVAR